MSRKVRKLHKWLGLIASAYVLMAVTSGIIHIIIANFLLPPPPVMPEGIVNIDKVSIPITQVIKKLPDDFGDVKALNFRTIKGELYYQFVSSKPVKPVYINAVTGKLENGMDEVFAAEIAGNYLKQKNLKNTEYVTQFNNEYLNIFRVLPVYKFEANNNIKEKVYVSTITNSTTLYLNKYRSLAQFSFSYLHKFQFIGNKIVRDILLGLSALSVLFVSILGVYIFAKGIRRA